MNRLARTSLVILAVACWCALASPALAAPGDAVERPSVAAAVPFVIDESIPGFRNSPVPLLIPAGTVRLTVYVPSSAKGKHGVGIDGGYYDDVEGAAVLPGRATSLMIDLKPGDYTIYDPFASNRTSGYALNVRVVSKVETVPRPGRRCKFFGGYFAPELRVRRTTCNGSSRLMSIAYERWRASGFSAADLDVRGFKCHIDMYTPVGILVTCKRGTRQIRASA